MKTLVKEWLESAVLVIGMLLFVDLFLGWHHASVLVAGNVVAVKADSSAWAGWGVVAGVFLIVLLLWEGFRLAGAAFTKLAAAELVTFMLAVVVAAFTLIEFVAGAAEVNTPLVSVDVHDRQWPAYVGLVLATCLVAAAAAQFGRVEPRHTRRLGVGVR